MIHDSAGHTLLTAQGTSCEFASSCHDDQLALAGAHAASAGNCRAYPICRLVSVLGTFVLAFKPGCWHPVTTVSIR
jgi:hypothetical protein